MKKVKICENTFEHTYCPEGKLVVGMDEAGRGPLAGPLSVAGVIFPIGYQNDEIYDSKSLSEKKRERLYNTILEDALWYQIIEVSEKDIDRYNILEADRRAMRQIAMNSPAEIVLSDAVKLDLPKPVFDIIKGDQQSVSIAAASILAKVTRDHIMKMYDKKYPEYGFASNKGYPTKAHMDAIQKYGITEIHRRSFGPVRAVQQKLDI